MKSSVLVSVLAVAVSVQIVNSWVVGLGGLGIGLPTVGLRARVGLQTGVGVGLPGVAIGDADVGGVAVADVGGVAVGATGCRCLAVDNRNRGVVLRDFGIIQACGVLTLCGCNAIGVRSCRRVCQQVVEVWADNVCPIALKGTEVRAVFQSSLCAAGMGDGAEVCDGNGLTGVVVPLLPNLIL